MITRPLPRLTPAEAGIDPAGIADFIAGLDQLESPHSVMLLRHGAVVTERWWSPYAADLPHQLFSISKSFTSVAVGFAVTEGLLTVDDRVVDLLPDDLPAVVGPHLAAMRVRDLLTMTTGHAVDTIEAAREYGGDNWSRAVLSVPVDFEPGTHFVYNTGATYLLAAILHSLTRERLLDYLTPRLFEPLGIAGATWDQCPRGIDVGGWGLSITTEELAAFGQLLLEHGVVDGRQVVPRAWLDEATSKVVPNDGRGESADWEQGYGYQFWRARHGAYRGDGAFGQYVVVLEEQDAVLVTTGGMDPMHEVLELAWRHLLPAIDRAPGTAVIPEGLALPTVAGGASAPDSVVDRRWQTSEPTLVSSVTIHDTGEAIELVLGTPTGEYSIVCGIGRWVRGSTGFGGGEPVPIAASAGWRGAELTAVVLFTHSPFAYIITATADDDSVELHLRANVSFGATDLGRVRLT